MSRYDSATGTLLFWPDRSCIDGASDVLRALDQAGLVMLRDDDEHWDYNPMERLDPSRKGVFIRVLPTQTSGYGMHLGWGGIDWDKPEQAEAVLAVAETLAMRTYNRWFALCDYEGWDAECTEVTELASFDDFRSLLRTTATRGTRAGRHRNDQKRQHPVECHVYKVHGPPWTPGS